MPRHVLADDERRRGLDAIAVRCEQAAVARRKGTLLDVMRVPREVAARTIQAKHAFVTHPVVAQFENVLQPVRAELGGERAEMGGARVRAFRHGEPFREGNGQITCATMLHGRHEGTWR